MSKVTVQMSDHQITASFEYLIGLPDFSYTKQVYDHYRPGNVVWVSYWQSYDLVKAFRLTNWGTWEVEVIACDKDGVPLADAKVRTHMTNPDKWDKVINHIN